MTDVDRISRRYTLEELLENREIEIPDPPCSIGVGKHGEPRLMISKIVNVNFKSYAGTKIIGPFHKAFSSIIGPNGSGKSNVIDSMLFVFGYRANKIRNKKVSGLIHNSEKHPDMKSAVVEVHFCMINDLSETKHQFEVIQGSEFVVSRTAYKDNSSSYSIDGRKTNFKEVGVLLRTKGIDLDHNRFLILQGEVEQISQMKPKAENDNDEGMLEYLEDIIGSSRLKPIIDRLNNEVEQLNEYRIERNNRVKLAEEDRNKLQEGYQEAKKWMELKNELTRDTNKLYQVEKFHKENQSKQLNAEKEIVETEYKEYLQKIKEEKDKNRDIYKEHEKALKKQTKVQKAFQGNKDKLNELEAKNTELFEEKKMKKKRKADIIKHIKVEEEKVVKFSEMPNMCLKQEEEINQEIESLVSTEKAYNVELQRAIEIVEKDTEKLRKDKGPLEKEMLKKQEISNKKAAVLEEEKTALETFTEKYDRAQLELEQITSEITATENSTRAQAQEFETLKKEVPQFTESLKNMEIQIETLKDKRIRLQEEVGEVQVKLNDAKQQGGEQRQRNQVFDYIMNNLKRKNIVQGIYGRLGDLGGIPRKYDIAISSAANMDVVVVETTVQGKAILGHLASDNVGSCSILALEKMRPFRAANHDLPGERLVDQITCEDPRLMNCFYKAVGETLVAPNSIEAEKMSFGGRVRHRVVALTGEIIETHGTITGGGSRPRSGAMGEKAKVKVNEVVISEEEINRMAKFIDELRSTLRATDDSIRGLGNEVRTTKSDLAWKNNRLDQLANLNSTDEQKIIMLKSRQPEKEKLVESLKPDFKELEKIKDSVRDAEVDFGAAESESATAKQHVDEINRQMLEIGKGRIQGNKKQIDKAKNDIKSAKKKILKIQNDAKTSCRNRDKADANLKSMQSELAEIETRSTKIAEDQKVLMGEFQEATSDKTELEEAQVQIVEIVKTATEKVEQFEKLIENLKNHANENDRKLSHVNAKIKDVEESIQAKIIKLKRLKIEEIEEGQDLMLQTYEEEDFKSMDLQYLITQVNKLSEHEAHRPNLRAITEYRQRNKVYNDRVNEFNIVNDARNTKRDMRNDLIKRRQAEFMEGFDIITDKVKQMYQMITLGGDAELELVNTLAPFEDGVVFTVRPPKKSWKNIWNLSGGEKTLSSLALVFALHQYKPTPLYVMDEIDAALDIKNVSIVAHYIKERTKNAQFIIISLRNQMFGLASKLVGIYKTDNTTKTVVILNETETTIDVQKADKVLRRSQPTIPA